MTDPRSLCYRLSIPHTVLTKDKRGEEGWSNRMEFHTNSKQMNIARESSGVLLRIPPELNLLFLLPFASGELCWPWVFPVKTHLSSKRHMLGSRVHPSLFPGEGLYCASLQISHQQVGISWHPEACFPSCWKLLPQQAESNASFPIILTYLNVRSWILGGKGSYTVLRGYYFRGFPPPGIGIKTCFLLKEDMRKSKTVPTFRKLWLLAEYPLIPNEGITNHSHSRLNAIGHFI